MIYSFTINHIRNHYYYFTQKQINHFSTAHLVTFTVCTVRKNTNSENKMIPVLYKPGWE